jgi:hypothetical protein
MMITAIIITTSKSTNLVEKLIVAQMINVYDRVHKRVPLNPTLSSTNHICAVITYLIKIQRNIVALSQSVQRQARGWTTYIQYP